MQNLQRLLMLVGLAIFAAVACGDGVMFEMYRVGQGDTMEVIASHFNSTPDQIRKRNGLAADELIYVGQSLIVPVNSRESPAESALVLPPPPVRRAPVSNPTSRASSAPNASSRVVGRLGVVVERGARIRSQRKARSRVYFSPNLGMQVVVTQEVADWYGVLMSNGSTGWVPKRSVRLENVELVARSPLFGGGGGSAVVAEAWRFLGVPYHYGGNGGGGIDCSALVQRAYLASRGVSLPRTAAEQARVGYEVSPEQLQPGDRIYFSRSGLRIDHCGIFIGQGQFIHASGAANRVTVNSLYESKYAGWFRLARR